MKNILIAITLVFFVTGCAVVGPGPTENGYSNAVQNFTGHKEALYTSGSEWFPNVLLGSASSFNSSYIEGRLFITPERLIFAVYDSPTNSYLEAKDILYSDIDWITGKHHGLSRILRVRTDESLDSFAFSGGYAIDTGENVGKDTIMKYVLGRF